MAVPTLEGKIRCIIEKQNIHCQFFPISRSPSFYRSAASNIPLMWTICGYHTFVNVCPSVLSICLQTQLCKGPTYHNTPKCLLQALQPRYESLACWIIPSVSKPVSLWCIVSNVDLMPLQENSVQQQQVAIETPTDHTTYTYQHGKWRGGGLLPVALEMLCSVMERMKVKTMFIHKIMLSWCFINISTASKKLKNQIFWTRRMSNAFL